MRTMINLLPLAYRRQQLVRKRVFQWTTVTVVVLLAGWGWHWIERREAHALIHELESLEREYTPNRTMLRQLVEMRTKLEELQQQEVVARELEFHRNALTLLGVISDTVKSRNGRARVSKIELTNFQNMQPSDARELKGNFDSLKLSGVALDNPAAADMVVDLQKSGIFNRVELTLIKERAEGEVSLRDYEIHCEF